MIPQFANKEDLFNWFRENKHLEMAARKSQMKLADAVTFIVGPEQSERAAAEKDAGVIETMPSGVLVARCIINTTNILDSHSDVHIPGIWKKSLQETKLIYHLQEHKMQFDKVITDEVKAFTKSMSWKSLAFDYEGSTQALVFDSTIGTRNEYMKAQYEAGYVKNHSVGMIYVQQHFCINSDSKWWIDEKANWDKYIDQVVNKTEAEDRGYFYAITEAKVIEGSAVLIGSNRATPTISITGAGKTTPDDIPEPPAGTQKDYSKVKFI